VPQLGLNEFHRGHAARFAEVHGEQVVEDYGDILAEYHRTRAAAGVLDLSFRGRLCLTGADRARFLHGQVTNNIHTLAAGQGCYAALVTAKGKLESDLNIYCLSDEFLLDFEPGLAQRIRERLERFIVSEDVQVIDVASQYGLLSIVGPRALDALTRLGLQRDAPSSPFSSVVTPSAQCDLVITYHPLGNLQAFDLFVPVPAMQSIAEQLMAAAVDVGGGLSGWRALEMLRVEAGLPRFGVDMDESHLAPETGIESRAIRYDKGCYIGQEVINKLRTFAHVNKSLCGFVLASDLKTLPERGAKLFRAGKEAGYITTAVESPALGRTIALGYARTEHTPPGTLLQLHTSAGDVEAEVVPLPFVQMPSS
jgi:folate-binding protein YgfZ